MNLAAPVLIIDDDPQTTDMLKECLEAAGHTAAVARNGFHGLRLAREVKPSVILCDMKMPNMAGSDVLRALASDPATASIPRVLMTGLADADRSHANAFLLKPFLPDDMLTVLRRVTRIPFDGRAQETPESQWRG